MNQVPKLYLLFWAITFGIPSHSWGQGPAKVIRQQAIQETDIKRDLYALANDHFRGREAGTLDELKASAWIAEQLRAMGLQPAGDDGTFFQFFHLQRTRISETSRLTIGSHVLTFDENAIIRRPAIASVGAPLIFVGKGTAALILLRSKSFFSGAI